MIDRVGSSLSGFSHKYCSRYYEKHGCLPVNGELVDWSSPCVVERNQDIVLWQPTKREEPADFSNIEHALNLQLHDSIKTFFGSQFCGDMECRFRHMPMTLIQVWNDDDFKRLQENIIGHLLMQRRLKLKPTVFIAGLDDELDIISVCNLTGQVLLEKIGTNQRDVLSSSLDSFLDDLELNF